jgi:hypothetical protein
MYPYPCHPFVHSVRLLESDTLEMQLQTWAIENDQATNVVAMQWSMKFDSHMLPNVIAVDLYYTE